MATNKNATIRYNTLDKCFRNTRRNYYIEDLLEACNEALICFDGECDGVKRRQIYEDIRFMKSEQGWSVPLETIKDGRRIHYRYEDLNYSISNEPLSDLEASQLKESLATLSRFKGLPQFEWIEEIHTRLEDAFLLDNETSVIGFDTNEYLKGKEYISILYRKIVSKRSVSITYKPFKSPQSIIMVLHPYFIKQYNNRWFLFGLNDARNQITNVALDRIEDIADCKLKYIKNTNIDFNEYFEDVLGVTIPVHSEVEKILLRVDGAQWPYIKTKPIHGSQKIKEEKRDYSVIELELIINYEFISLLLSMGEKIIVISPASLQTSMKEHVESMFKNY